MFGTGVKQKMAGGLIALMSFSFPAMAADLFTPPDGCAVYLSVQTKGCRVSHHYICEADPKGDQWRADFNADGAYFVSRINAEGEWLNSIDLNSGMEMRLQPGAADPASLTGLIDSGTDTYDFAQLSSDGDLLRYRGFDTLTGRKVVIDGVGLEETSFEFRESSARMGELGTASGREYIHRAWRLFFPGPSQWQSAGAQETIDRSPVRFDQAGDPGFRSTKPEFDCNAQLAALK